jgi:phytoene synthase
VRGRLYLPLEDLARFGVGEDELLAAARSALAPRPPRLSALLEFEADRAREHYRRAAELLPAEDRRAMAPAEIMGAIYRTLLEEFARRGCPLGGPRVRLSSPRKAWVALRALGRVYGVR